MGSEIIVPETPNWLQELEAKREKRLKARLGHEAGAGAPCLKCGDKCPGLDLHFWRKCCKICKCTKEDHEVQDEDIYGWAQFQLLGSKPNKIKKKIVLPGKKDELELDWIPKGHNDTVEKYLKTVPPELLPVKGSQAAQDRKQLLQKQIPVHDVDPTLCHELSEDELKNMNEYIAHVKQSSVGVGQIVSLSSLIKGNLHMLNPQEAAMIASRYAKGVPLSEIVMLQSQSRAERLKQQDLSENLQNININDPQSAGYQRIYDKNNLVYTDAKDQLHIDPQFSNLLETKRNPSAFVPYNNAASFISRPGENYFESQSPQKSNYAYNLPHHARNIEEKIKLHGQHSENAQLNDPNYASALPHTSKISSQGVTPQQPYSDNTNFQNPKYAETQFRSISRGLNPHEMEQNASNFNISAKPSPITLQGAEEITISPHGEQYYENVRLLDPTYGSQLNKLPNPQSSVQNQYEDLTGNKQHRYNPADMTVYSDILHSARSPKQTTSSSLYNPAENADNLRRLNKSLPNYVPGKHSAYPDNQEPQHFENVGVEDPQSGSLRNKPFNPQYGLPYQSGKTANSDTDPNDANQIIYSDILHPNSRLEKASSSVLHDQTEKGDNLSRTSKPLPNYLPGRHAVYPDNQTPTVLPKNVKDLAFSTYDSTNVDPNNLYQRSDEALNLPEDPYVANQNLAKQIIQGMPKPLVGENLFSDRGLQPPNVPQPPIPGKKLTEQLPRKIDVSEDYMHPDQVTIGAIQDINYPEIKAATQGTNDFYEDYSPDSMKEILNNIKLPDCHYCKKPFEENEFAITIDRANVLFHANCFRCAGCNQILADNVYFYNKETDNIYCGRDYAKVRGFPRCKACDELIFTKEYCLAENASFHIKHFCCYECDTPLAGQDYTIEDEMPYCLPCFENSKASKCNSCERLIKTDETGCSLNGIDHFHATEECFSCKICRKSLMGQKLLLRNHKLYCSHQCFGLEKQ